MRVQIAPALNALLTPVRSTPVRAFASAAAAANATPATADATVSISQAARDQLANSTGATIDTDRGAMTLDLEAYFTPPGPEGVDIETVPLLASTPRTVDALTQYVSDAMPDFLARHGIARAPASITYDDAGQLQLPADYPDAAAFKQALADEPAMERAMRTTAALTSSMVEMAKSLPFQQAYLAADSQAAADAVVAKYSALFSNTPHVDRIALNFSANGTLHLTHDGKALDQA